MGAGRGVGRGDHSFPSRVLLPWQAVMWCSLFPHIAAQYCYNSISAITKRTKRPKILVQCSFATFSRSIRWHRSLPLGKLLVEERTLFTEVPQFPVFLPLEFVDEVQTNEKSTLSNANFKQFLQPKRTTTTVCSCGL